jgi:hypothetical protein
LLVPWIGTQSAPYFSLESQDGAGDHLPAQDEFFQERGGDVERQITDDLDLSARGAGFLAEIGFEDILVEERDVLDSLMDKAILQDLSQSGIFFDSDHMADRPGQGKSQGSQARTDFHDHRFGFEVRPVKDLTYDGRITQKVLP